MISLLTAFFLYSADAGWGWWVAYGLILALETIGVIYKVNHP